MIAAIDALDRRESSDSYLDVTLAPQDGWRVIRCRHGIQWILQKGRIRAGETEWRSVRYHRNRNALIRSTLALCPSVDTSALRSLPEWCEPASDLQAERLATAIKSEDAA